MAASLFLLAALGKAAEIISVCVVRIYLNRLVQVDYGPVVITLRLEAPPTRDIEVGVLWIDLDGHGEIAQGAIVVVARGVRKSPRIVGVRGVRIDFDRLAEVSPSAIAITLSLVGTGTREI